MKKKNISKMNELMNYSIGKKPPSRSTNVFTVAVDKQRTKIQLVNDKQIID